MIKGEEEVRQIGTVNSAGRGKEKNGRKKNAVRPEGWKTQSAKDANARENQGVVGRAERKTGRKNVPGNHKGNAGRRLGRRRDACYPGQGRV